MPIPEDPDRQDELLTEKIGELESLLDNNTDDMAMLNNEMSGTGHSYIPILDEMICDNDYTDAETQDSAQLPCTENQLTELINNLEQRLTGELGKLVAEIRENLKDDILGVLRSQPDQQVTDQQTAQEDEQSTEQDSQDKDKNATQTITGHYY
ncbi:MAG: hypothetical protein O6928_02160 [Gammaproteobacteria bacterium]|nr:hypothetical protein [Gammaproteobacteria bacterium]